MLDSAGPRPSIDKNHVNRLQTVVSNALPMAKWDRLLTQCIRLWMFRMIVSV